MDVALLGVSREWLCSEKHFGRSHQASHQPSSKRPQSTTFSRTVSVIAVIFAWELSCLSS